MRDYIYIGCSPVEEECVQVSSTVDYLPAMRAELAIYKRQLERTYPTDTGGYFSIKWSGHDFGTYGEVVAVYDSDDDAQTDWAYGTEEGCDYWDAIAIAERRAAGLPEVDHV